MLARVKLRPPLADNDVPRNNILVCDVPSVSNPRSSREKTIGERTREFLDSQPFSRGPSVVSDRATGAFRGSPDRSQACIPGGESRQQKHGPVILPVKEKGLEAGTDCTPRKRPNQVIVFEFWWRGRCAKGEEAYVKDYSLENVISARSLVTRCLLPLFFSISSPRQTARNNNGPPRHL